MTSVAPRIVMDVSCVRRIKPHECHFSWQARTLFGDVGG